jgi:beta-glucosidase
MKIKRIPARPTFFVLALTLFAASLAALADPNPSIAPLAKETPPYLDPDRPVEQRVADLISRLTLEQKAALLNHKGSTVTVDGRPSAPTSGTNASTA